MCLIALALEASPHLRLVLAGNRDEFHDRPADPAAWWHDHPGLLGGRDRQALGTWLGMSRDGRLATITNVREPERARTPGPSRGNLPLRFLARPAAPHAFAQALRHQARQGEHYAGYNLLLLSLQAEGTRACWSSNRHEADRELAPGIYGLSNHLLDTPWPKVTRLKRAMADALALPDRGALEQHLFQALADASPADEHDLPDSGVPRERERMLSAPFVRSRDYGTRASTVVLVGRDGVVDFIERSWPAEPANALDFQERRHRFTLASDRESA